MTQRGQSRADDASQVVVLNKVMWLLLNKNLCKQRDPEIEFDFNEKHVH